MFINSPDNTNIKNESINNQAINSLYSTAEKCFEIKDFINDDPHLKTVPQQIGVKKTKNLGFVLLILFVGLSSIYYNINGNFNINGNGNGNFNYQYLELNFVIAIVIALFLFFSTENRSKYYTDFWVESIPIVWWLLYLFTK